MSGKAFFKYSERYGSTAYIHKKRADLFLFFLEQYAPRGKRSGYYFFYFYAGHFKTFKNVVKILRRRRYKKRFNFKFPPFHSYGISSRRFVVNFKKQRN